MSVKEKFVLKWADYSTTVTAALQELRNMEELFDITLAVENKQILAHKLVLAASSPFFRNVIKNNPHQHPLLYLKGVKYSSLVSILNFMYHGQVSVAQDELTSFLNVAEELNVRGLTNNQSTESKYESDRDSQSSHRKNNANDKVVDLDSDDNDNDDDDKDEIKVSKVVNPKKRTHNYDNIMSQSPAKRAMVTKSTSERSVTQDKMRPISSPSTSAPRNIKKEKKRDNDEVPYIPTSSRKASVDYDNEEDFEDSNSGVNGIRRSKRKSKKRVFPDAVADLKDFSDNEADKIPGRLIQRPRAVVNDSDASDIDNLLENDTNDDTTSDNEKQDESIEIDVEESTTKLKKEIKKEIKKEGRKEEYASLPVLADKGFHDPTYHKSTSEPEQESDDPDREIIATLNEALDDLTKDYIVQVPSKDWKCLSCLKLFYAKQSCQNHVEAEHLVSPGHVCPTCFKSVICCFKNDFWHIFLFLVPYNKSCEGPCHSWTQKQRQEK
eukprot:TRINITY_DN860_c0_g1_i1.p1 TRINITY_DN860_c0_g1~~TRINITY_DN860_c0_g1_i1.p1  ORF type:complete len:515 (-),score=124.22 TRINITY_DN860_c0_g1_i1:214-1698(-)